ncbi:MAG: MFS transporter [Spirochaetales bacterium]|nr:MFS transporter [Spirochaetales bacterium]
MKLQRKILTGNYGWFLSSMLLFGLAFGLFLGVRDNYLAEILLAEPFFRGVVEFFRELPGLLLFLILAIFYRTPENKIIRWALFICLAGMGGMFFAGNERLAFVAFLTLWSTGEHILLPVRQSFAVHNARDGEEGQALGILKSVTAIGQVAGFFLVPLIFLLFPREGSDLPAFHFVFILVMLAILASLALTVKLQDDSGRVKRQRFYLDKKFSKFYWLHAFYGGRKQVFLTFAPYVLILHYGASTELIATLLGVCSLINILFTPLVGRIIDKAGYKIVMVLDTVFLFFICLIYGFAHRLFPMDVAFYVVCGTFILDAMVSNASMATSVYVSRISDSREEMASTLSTGLSINHVISVAIALAGGVIWERLGIELLFIMASVMAVCNSLFALTIPRDDKVLSEKN